MRVVVTGATGFIGRALVAELDGLGHQVVVLSRNPSRASELLPVVAASYAFDAVHEIAPAAALDGADAIVHLAGEPVTGRWTAAKKKAIRDSRVLGTNNLVAGLAGLVHPPSQLICASAIGFYGDRGDEELLEGSGPGRDFLATTAVEWETAAASAVDMGLGVATLRIGIVLDPAGGALQQMLPPFRLGLGGPLGSGQQWWSWIHRHDLVRMIVFALDHKWAGAFNATAPKPLRQADFARSLGQRLRRPALVRAPAFALRARFGEFASELLTSKRVQPAAAAEAGFQWEFGQLDRALADLLP